MSLDIPTLAFGGERARAGYPILVSVQLGNVISVTKQKVRAMLPSICSTN